LSRYCVVSFDPDGIRILRGRYGKGRIAVEEAATLDESGLEVLLRRRCRDKFVVVAGINEIYQDILFLPNVDPKLFQPMIRGEIRKALPDLTDYSFFYRVIGEALHEGRQFKKVAIFAYSDKDAAPYVDRFVRANKSIEAFYPASYAMSRLQQTDTAAGAETMLCIADRKQEKLVLLLQRGQLYFSRSMQSLGQGFSDADVQNINMTIDYCLQSLRVKPEAAVLLNSPADLTVPPLQVSVPTRRLSPAPAAGISQELLADYCQAAGALMCTETIEEGNLLSGEYRNYFFRKRSLSYGAGAMAAVSVLALAAISYNSFNISDLNGEAARLRTEIAGQETARAAYARMNGELARLKPVIAHINKASASPDFQNILIGLQFLQEHRQVDFTSLTVGSADGQAPSMLIAGRIRAAGMGDTQAVLDGLVKALKEKAGLEITGQRLDAVEKSFTINAQLKEA
jgi:hypothetical protein